MAKEIMTKKEKVEFKDNLKKELTEEILDDIKKKSETKIINQVKNDVIKTIKEESINELKDTFVNEVKLDVKEKISKEEKKLLRNKRWKIIRRDIFILFLIFVIGYLCYYIYKNNDKDVVVKKESNVKTEEVVKDKDWYIENYGYLISYTHLNLSSDNLNKFYLYNQNYNVENINDSIKLTMAYNLIDKADIKLEDGKYIIDNNILKEAYNKLFNTTYKTTSFNIGCMTYNYKNKKYVAYETECTNINNYELVEDIINMYEEDNELVIETIMGVFSGSNLYNYTNLYSPINTSYNKDNSLSDFKGSLSSYKYTFEKEKDNYKFISIEKN